jgi:NitT/TauT family transport system substrate-binding protein
VVGGSADVVSGAFEHTINMLSKGQPMKAFVLAGRAPQITLGVSRRTVPNYKAVTDLKGKTVGVTAPGSSTHILTNFVLAKAGMKPTDVSVVGVGATTTAVAALRAGKIDAISNVDPVITILERSGDITVISDTRNVEQADRIFGGPMPAACLYAPASFVEKNPNTCQALANAMVRANKWIHRAGASEVLKIVPESYLLGDSAVYVDAFLKAKGATSPDGTFPEKGPETALRALASVDSKLLDMKLDLKSVYTNEFARKANLKYQKG